MLIQRRCYRGNILMTSIDLFLGQRHRHCAAATQGQRHKETSDNYPVPKIAGGITTIGDVVIVLDRLGNIYSYRPDAGYVQKLPFPALPNNINDYLLTPGAHVDTKTFRAYNIKYLAFAKLLAVSHEYFDKQHNGTRLAVSVIGFDVDSMQPIGGGEPYS